MGNLCYGVQAIAQKGKKTKNNLYHIYCNAPGLLSTIPGERQRASGCQRKRSEGDPKDAKDEGTKGATRALLSSPISHLWGRLRGQVWICWEDSWGLEITGNSAQKIFTQSVPSSDPNSNGIESSYRGCFLSLQKTKEEDPLFELISLLLTLWVAKEIHLGDGYRSLSTQDISGFHSIVILQQLRFSLDSSFVCLLPIACHILLLLLVF